MTRDEIQEQRKKFLMGKDQSSYECTVCPYVIRAPQSHFKDELSKREFVISGLCQPCQDEIFKGPDEK